MTIVNVHQKSKIDDMTLLDISYYEWLISQIKTPVERTYNDMFERMHNLEFVWTVPNDNNRVQDGIDLRFEFAGSDSRKLTLKIVTFLEVLVALSRRVAFVAGGDERVWAWILIKNIGLNKMSDPLTNGRTDKIEEILHTLIWRTYDYDGNGGFFPLKNPEKDQAKVEIWYQMNTYVNEMKDI